MPKSAPKTNRAPGQPASTKTLTDERYKKLLADVKELLQSAGRAEDHNRVTAHWKLGRRIARERLRSDAGYHNSILRDLSVGASVAKRTLQYAVNLHASYPTCPTSTLTLRHYRALLDFPAPMRARFEKLAIDQSLSADEMRALMLKAQREASGTSTLLPRPTDPSYIYQAAIEQVIDGDTLDLRIDVGFHMSRLDRFRLANINCPELPTPAGRKARDYVYQRLFTAKTLVVKTERTDLHGRYVAHLFYSTEDLATPACFEHGVYLNAELLEAGHAVLGE